MGKVLFVSCTPVARYMMQEILMNPSLASVEICGVVNLNTKQSIEKANYDSYNDLVLKFSLPIHYCCNVNDDETLEWISAKNPDVIIQSGWSQKFHKKILCIPRYTCIGEHPSPLPVGRGAACVNWAILNGEKQWGDSFFEMVEQYDKGALLAQKFFSIDLRDDVATVYDKIAFTSAQIIRENIIDWSAGIFNKTYQDDLRATYYKRRKPDDGIIDFSLSALETYNCIRAQAKPYPGAFFMILGKRVKVWKASLTSHRSERKGVTFVGVSESGGVLAVCGDGNIIDLQRVQTEHEAEQWGADWYFLLQHLL